MANKIDIPNGWEVKKLGEVFKKINIKNKDKLITQVLTNSAQYGVIAQEEFFDKSIATKENINNYYILNIDDFIYNPRISKFAPAGPISRNKYKIGCVSPLYTVFKMTANYNIDFYELYFKSNIWNRQAYNIANFGARFDRMNITDTDFFNMPIPVPPLAEQEKIAEILSLWDKAIEQTKELIAYKEKQKKGLMQNLLTGKKRLSGFTDEWKTTKLGEVTEMNSGGTPTTSKIEYYNGNINWVSITDITSHYKHLYNTKTKITELGLQNSSAKIFPVNTILYAMYASIGECIIAKEEMTTSQAILGIRCSNNIYYEYLFYLLYNYKDKSKTLAQQGTQANLNKEIVENFIFQIPTSLDEQKAIADILCKADEEIELLKKQLDLYMEQKKGLMQNLLTGKVRVTV